MIRKLQTGEYRLYCASLRRELADYPRPMVIAAVVAAIDELDTAALVGAWLTSAVAADEADPPPLDASTVTAILTAVRRSVA